MRRRLWLALAIFTAAAHCTMVLRTQENVGLLLMTLTIWGGALLCIEDKLPILALRPSCWSWLAGVTLLISGLARTVSVIHPDAISLVLPLWLGLSLVLLCRPFNGLRPWLPSIVVLGLLPLSEVIAQWLLPEEALSHLTARLSQALLLLFGVDVAVAGRELALPGGSVTISRGCAGTDQIALLLVIAVIFLLAFRLPSRRSRWLVLTLAPLIALIVNAMRIVLLALIVSSEVAYKDWLFDFFHLETGALVFSGISVGILGWIYIRLLENQLQSFDDP